MSKTGLGRKLPGVPKMNSTQDDLRAEQEGVREGVIKRSRAAAKQYHPGLFLTMGEDMSGFGIPDFLTCAFHDDFSKVLFYLLLFGKSPLFPSQSVSKLSRSGASSFCLSIQAIVKLEQVAVVDGELTNEQTRSLHQEVNFPICIATCGNVTLITAVSAQEGRAT